MTLTDQELAAMLERAERATEGPWEKFYSNYDTGTWCVCPIDEATGLITHDDKIIIDDVETNDADFIAAARTDLPAVVKDLIEARGAISEMCEFDCRWAADDCGNNECSLYPFRALLGGEK